MGPLSKISIKWGFAFKVCTDKRIAARISLDFDMSMEPAKRLSQSWNSLVALNDAGDSSRHAIFYPQNIALLVNNEQLK
jgi:hypothetical protein